MRSADEIVELWEARKEDMGPLHSRAREVTDTYNGDISIPLPELDANEKKAVPNLLAQGLNQMAMRISSVMPDVYYPPLRTGFKEHEKVARIKRQATLGWWEASNMKLLLSRRARHLLGYSMSPVVIRHNMETNLPSWQLRHPLHTFPGETINPDDVHPPDCIFDYTRTYAWVKQQYPDKAMRLASTMADYTKVELLEYMDADETVLICVGDHPTPNTPGQRYVELERVVNRIGLCPAVVPGRITLDRRQGAFDGMVGLYQRQAKLMALEVIAVQAGIFPNEWLVARPNENPQVVREADGMRGVTGIVRGGELVNKTNNPGYRTDQTINTLERAQRLEGGIPAEFGGESTTNVRTGRRGDAILSAVVDFPVQEAHNVFETSLEIEDVLAAECAKAYSGDVSRSFYVNWKGAKGNVDYTPNVHFAQTANSVTYAKAGADINSLIIGIGQMIGVELISKSLGRELNPMIDDPEREHRRIIVEQMESASLAGIQQLVVSGQMAPTDVIRLQELMATTDKTLAEAMRQVQEEAQERQATAGPPGAPTGPVEPGAPEAQPGIAPPGNSAQAGVETPGAINPTEQEQGLASLLTALRHGASGAPTRQSA